MKRRFFRRTALGVVAAIVIATAAPIALALLFLFNKAGDAAVERARAVETSRQVVDRSEVLLRPFPITDGRWRLPVALDEVDPRFIEMLIAYEDSRFHSHAGVDPLAVLRAAWQWVKHGEVVSGASTLSMQVARLLAQPSGRGLSTKLVQMRDALRLELAFSKSEILELYLTLAPYGGNVEGIRAASLAWFGKEPRRLTPAETALLVALPQSPERRRPDRFPAEAQVARDRVIARLAAAGTITEAEAALALVGPVPQARLALPAQAPHLARRIAAGAPDEAVLRVTLDAGLQARLEALARERVTALGPRASLAILVADHQSGEALAEVGSAGLFADARAGHVDMVHAVRSPGSALKPLIYGLAFETGVAHPETLIEDRPVSFSGYRPRNFELAHQGTVSVRHALQASLNVPAVRLLEAVGPSRLTARLRRAGLAPVLPRQGTAGLPVGLGGVGLTLDDLVRLYAGMARGGEPVALRRAPEEGSPLVGEFLDSRAAWLVSDVLSGTPAPPGRGREAIAYKTGTSYGYRDAWAIGFDGQHVIGVWVGRPDGAPVPGMTGRTAAAPILFDAFRRVSPIRTALPPPPPDTLVARNGALPAALRRFAGDRSMEGVPGSRSEAPPVIVHPPDGARVDLALGEGMAGPLVIKLDGGRPPFRWFADGRPVGGSERRRATTWTPPGPGFSTISVVDARGEAASVTIFLE
ncbi:penicillin-binding protein 1C [Aquibaculum sediminis]|uniref:penicillin-binding protein 1C n=1 Tax=Aquibaculum sediminis TaxID=3231907 RepID=UPI0034547FCC